MAKLSMKLQHTMFIPVFIPVFVGHLISATVGSQVNYRLEFFGRVKARHLQLRPIWSPIGWLTTTNSRLAANFKNFDLYEVSKVFCQLIRPY